jgi:hypothetical protein
MNLFKLFKRDRISLGFIDGPFDKVKVEMKSEIFPTLTERWKIKEFTLPDKNKVAEVYSISEFSVTKILMWQPVVVDFDLVVFITNMADGWQGLLRGYSEDYKQKIIRTDLSKPDITYPGYAFEVMSIDSTRLVQVIKDVPNWQFFQKGDILPFEESINYKKRRISDRLNNSIIEDYLKKNRIDINEEDFWKSKGKAIEFSTKLGKGKLGCGSNN